MKKKKKPEAYIVGKELKPESLMMSYGFKPELSQGAVKLPIFQNSTFVFEKAEDGKAFFEVAYGLREKRPHEEMGLIYSRLNNPNLEVLEDRLTLWDRAEEAARSGCRSLPWASCPGSETADRRNPCSARDAGTSSP